MIFDRNSDSYGENIMFPFGMAVYLVDVISWFCCVPTVSATVDWPAPETLQD